MSDTTTGPFTALSTAAFEDAYATVTAAARDAGMSGFGGECWAMAVAINRVVFDGAGTLVAGMNAPLAGAGRYIGHAAVRVHDGYWDLDGRAKEYEDIESWGMLDPGDSDYREAFAFAGLNFSPESAEDSSVFEFDDEAEFIAMFRVDVARVDALEAQLREMAVTALSGKAPGP